MPITPMIWRLGLADIFSLRLQTIKDKNVTLKTIIVTGLNCSFHRKQTGFDI